MFLHLYNGNKKRCVMMICGKRWEIIGVHSSEHITQCRITARFAPSTIGDGMSSCSPAWQYASSQNPVLVRAAIAAADTPC